MQNRGNDGRGSFLTPQPSWKERTQRSLAQLIDFVLASHNLMIAKGYYTQEEHDKMENIIADFRKRLGNDFNIEEGLKASRAAFKLTLGGKPE